MPSLFMRFLPFILLALLPAAARAQAGPAWPRNAAGRIELRGQLPWPDTARTEAQRQQLVRRWYRRSLTSDGPAHLRKLADTYGTTYAGVPAESCYQLHIAGRAETYRLCFRLHLTAETDGLRYQLTGFEASESSFDLLGVYALEQALRTPTAEAQAVLAGFCQRLLAALKGW